MEELLEQLETRIKSMLEKHDLLQEAHQNLQQNQLHLTSEKKQLQEKHQGAISQIERMIARLKPLEEKA